MVYALIIGEANYQKPTNRLGSMKTENFDQPGSLMLETQRMLKERDLLAVYTATGISFYWLRKFASGEFKNPSVNRVQSLYEFLKGEPLLTA